MTKSEWPWLLSCFTAVAWAALPTPARAADEPDITVQSQPVLPSGGSTSGYVEYRFRVTNHSTDKTHRVTLRLPDYFLSLAAPHRNPLTRTVAVAPLASVRVSLFYPNFYFLNGMYSGNAEKGEASVDGKVVPLPIRLDGVQQRGRHLSASYFGPRSGHAGFSGYEPCVLVSNKVQGGAQLLLNKAGLIPLPLGRDPNTGGAFTKPNCHFNVATTPVAAWSTNWLAYTCYDGVLLTAADLTRLGDPDVADGPGIRDALWRYAEAGGCLVVAGSWKVEVPQPWRRRTKKVHGLDVYYVGFGQCLVVPAGTLPNWRPEQCRDVVEAWCRSQQPWANLRSVIEANQAFPVVASVEIPFRGLFVLMVCFCLVIGPGNFYVLARRKRRLWILWTVPTLSLATSLAVIGYQYSAEGWQGQVRRQGLTLLDEANGRATTLGWAGYYAPLAPSDGLHFDSTTELIPQWAEGGSTRGVALDLDWTDDEQHLSKGWLRPRIPAHFMVRKSEARGEHLLVKQDANGSLTLVNRLGADIRQLWLADREGRIYTTSGLASDGETVLQPTTERLDEKPNLTGLRSAYGEDWVEHVRLFTAHPRKYLLPQTYLAVLEDEPFIEEGLRNAKKKQGEAVVYGILGP